MNYKDGKIEKAAALARNVNDHYECKQIKVKLGIKNCRTHAEDDYWSCAVKKCHEVGLHLPSTQTPALATGACYGRSDITPYTVISSVQFAKAPAACATTTVPEET